jgi:hypothetical protein
MNNDSNFISNTAPTSKPGPFLAKVVSHLDTTYMGILEVEILRPTGSTNEAGQLHQVKYMSPFYGVTNVDYVGADPDDYNNTQKSYGMWMVPPDPGTTVIIIFIDGDPKRGYWIGCVQDENMNFMVPGLAATQNVVNGSARAPTAEYNKKVNSSSADPTQFKKPVHPMAARLSAQGLINDDIRGLTTSSARREAPSMVFGISTPGPLDKQQNAKQGYIGKIGHQVNSFVSRLGGSTFVMDDGDDKFLRKKPASEGPPDYAAVEQGGTDGDRTIPHNELIRLRTRTGHQILMHNSEDLIYIGNARGTTWIELTSNGKIDIFAEDSISIHTGTDINVTAGRDINFNAANDINLNATNKVNISSTASDLNLIAKNDVNITALVNTNMKSAHHIETADKIDMNGPVAKTASAAKIPSRIPLHEPWEGHENLDPASFVPLKTRAITPVEPPVEPPKPAFWKKYTTITDTFNKVKGA